MSRFTWRKVSGWIVLAALSGALWLAASGVFGDWPQRITIVPAILVWLAGVFMFIRGTVEFIRRFREGWREGGQRARET